MSGTVETVTGRVKRIRYQGKGYWTICEIEHPSGVVVLVKGQMPGVYEGDMVSCTGKFKTDEKWGKELVVDRIEREERSGIETVLELLPDVGPKRAAQIREAFAGEDVFAVIEKEPTRLAKIPGLTAERIDNIRKALLDRKAERDLIVWCGDNGVSAYHAGLIWHKFKGESLKVLKERPYDVVGADRIGFLTADRIARRAGADPNGMPRARAAILYVLGEAETAEGSTVVEAGMLMAALKGRQRGPGGRTTACQLSPPLGDETVYAALGELRAEREVYVGGTDPVLVQRGITRATETKVAELLAAFALLPAEPPPEPPNWRKAEIRDRDGADDDPMETGVPF